MQRPLLNPVNFDQGKLCVKKDKLVEQDIRLSKDVSLSYKHKVLET